MKSICLLAMFLTLGAANAADSPSSSSSNPPPPSSNDWPNNNAPMSCMRMAYGHFISLGNNTPTAWNNARNACRKGMDSQCLATTLKYYQGKGQNPRTAWNNALRDCRELMPPY